MRLRLQWSTLDPTSPPLPQPPASAGGAALELDDDVFRSAGGAASRFGPPPPHVPKHREKMTGSCVEAVTSFSGCAPDGTLDNTHVYVCTANLDATMVWNGAVA